IDEEGVSTFTEYLKPKIDQLRCTFFETTTAIAFLYFAREKVDIAVVETGLGGRLDATNVLRPLLTVITGIGLEHTEHLGKTLARIAREKAGIMKRGIPCLIGEMRPQVRRALSRAAKSRGVKLVSASSADYDILCDRYEGIEMDLRTPKMRYKNLLVSLAGRFQAENARLAVLASELINGEDFTIKSSHVHAGLKHIRHNTGFRGRLETIRKRQRVIVDVAHNPDAVNRLVEALQSLSDEKFIVVFGVMRDKDHEEMILGLRRIARRLIAVAPKIERALDVQKLSRSARRLGFRVSHGGTVKSGVALALRRAGESDTVLITGSHFVVGEALEVLDRKV
ncbi:MAG: cyanophycin synthetase, partial [Bacteroidota bacterium]